MTCAVTSVVLLFYRGNEGEGYLVPRLNDPQKPWCRAFSLGATVLHFYFPDIGHASGAYKVKTPDGGLIKDRAQVRQWHGELFVGFFVQAIRSAGLDAYWESVPYRS